MDNVIEVSRLRKTYGPVVAVDEVSFGVRQGEIFGILGPNGAGKTTTVALGPTLGRQQHPRTVFVCGEAVGAGNDEAFSSVDPVVMSTPPQLQRPSERRSRLPWPGPRPRSERCRHLPVDVTLCEVRSTA